MYFLGDRGFSLICPFACWVTALFRVTVQLMTCFFLGQIEEARTETDTVREELLQVQVIMCLLLVV